MLLVGTIAKRESPWWSADVDVLGAYTQGKSKTDAAAALARLIEGMVKRDGFKVTIAELEETSPGVWSVLVDATEPALLAARVLRFQREFHRLTLADVAKRLDSSINNYAAYEQGKREPSLTKFRALLGAVAPELALTLTGPRLGTKKAPRAKPRRRRKASRPRSVGIARSGAGDISRRANSAPRGNGPAP